MQVCKFIVSICYGSNAACTQFSILISGTTCFELLRCYKHCLSKNGSGDSVTSLRRLELLRPIA